MWYTYLFEAKSIQNYIFSTSKLKEIIGGSELIEQITSENGLINNALEALKIKSEVKLSRCGGAAFYAFSQNEAALNKLLNVWPLIFRRYAPELEFIHATGKGGTPPEAFKEAHKRLLLDRNQPKVNLPQAGVYTLRSSRTGGAVTKNIKVRGESHPVDSVTHRKHDFSQNDALIKRVVKESGSKDWPINLTPEEGDDEKNFPFLGDSQVVALIHADGNGFGQLLMDLKQAVDSGKIKSDEYINVFKAISESIKIATEQSAEQAVDSVLSKHKNLEQNLYPARPIVLGGDDLTMIVRADLALSFTKAFLKAFEKNSAVEFEKLKSKYPNLNKVLPNQLTACAGIVYAKSSMPFSMLHDLAEDLCSHTKKIAKDKSNLLRDNTVPSSLSFYRVTNALIGRYDDIVRAQLTTAEGMRLTRGCYTLQAHNHLPCLTDLLGLQAVLERPDFSKGGLRQVVGLLHSSVEQAQRRYDRWKEVQEARNKEDWSSFSELRIKLSEFPGTDSAFEVASSTPFEDVLSLIAINNEYKLSEGSV